jgi:uncharacterized membrane protein
VTGTQVVSTLFKVSVITKGLDGALEILGGALLFFLSPAQIHGIVRLLTQHELSEDPRDMVARYLMHRATDLPEGVRVFAAIYLLGHGLIKLGLVTGLLLRKKWAYPAAMAAFTLFVAYQLYRYSHTGSLELLVLSAVDVAIIALTFLEYRRLRAIQGFHAR